MAEEHLKFIRQPQASVIVSIPIRMDDTSTTHFTGFRTHNSYHARPVLGGTRMDVDFDLEMAEALSALMTVKSQIVHLPFGGSHGGIRCDPKRLSFEEKRKIVRKYTEELAKHDFCGPATDVMGPDIGLNENLMGVMMDAYRMKHPKDVHCLATVTGKPREVGGITAREEASGLGVFFALKEYLNDKDFCERAGFKKSGLKGKSVIIAGLGQVGYNFGKFAQDAGMKVVGVLQREECLYNPRGMDVRDVKIYKAQNGTLEGFPDAMCYQDPAEVLGKQCDIFVPAAKEQYITKKNVDPLRCKVIVEAANSPLTPGAEEILESRGVQILPDILVNSGSVTVSYFEYVKNLGHIAPGRMTKRWQSKSNIAMLKPIKAYLDEMGIEGNWDEEALEGATEKDLVYSGLEQAMITAIKETEKTAREKGVSLRIAGYVNALRRINRTTLSGRIGT